MSSRAFADAAGVSPSTITRIETGVVDPTVGMLQRLLAVAGTTIEVVQRQDRSRSAPTLDFICSKRDELDDIAGRHGVTAISVFGSVASGTATADSDIDLLVSTGPSAGLLAVESFRRAAEELLGYPVDVVTDGAIKGRLAGIDDDAVRL